ncbi:response regulator [Magnetococcales bacterium HHB-1]
MDTPLKILIVDDERHHRVIMQKRVSAYGHCDLVHHGEAAIHAFELALKNHEPYHLVLLDIMMPFMDGQETLLKIRQLEEEAYGTPLDMQQCAVIIMVTCLDDSDNITEAYSHGLCNDYLFKPITKQKLIKKLQDNQLIDAT